MLVYKSLLPNPIIHILSAGRIPIRLWISEALNTMHLTHCSINPCLPDKAVWMRQIGRIENTLVFRGTIILFMSWCWEMASQQTKTWKQKEECFPTVRKYIQKMEHRAICKGWWDQTDLCWLKFPGQCDHKVQRILCVAQSTHYCCRCLLYTFSFLNHKHLPLPYSQLMTLLLISC